MDNVAKKLKFNYFGVYEYSHSKDNILTYIKQPEHFYSDWEENGGILVVKYRPEMTGKDRYVVLHCVEVENNGNIFPVDISSLNKIPEIVD